jgi:Fic family protein
MFPHSVRHLSEDLERAVRQDEFSLGLLRDNCCRQELAKEANKHSVEIEAVFDIKNLGPSEAKKKLKDMMQRQNNAWRYALDTIAKNQSFDEKDLTTIASYLVPGQRYNPHTGYRMEEVKITGAVRNPPSPMGVQEEMTHLMQTCNQLTSPLEKAIYAHYHIARIHPFEDGNGRTARIIQNALMCGAKYIPILIEKDQRDLYLQLLKDSDTKYYEGDKNYLHSLSEFLVYNLRKTIASIPQKKCSTKHR